MQPKKKVIWITMLVVFALLLACQCQLPGGLLSTPTPLPPPTPTPFVGGECDPNAIRLSMDNSLDGYIAGGDVFEETIAMFCLWVPDGGTNLIIGIRDFTPDLDIYVSVSYDELMSPTGFGEYYSNTRALGTPDQVSIPNPGGRYYIQVVSYEFNTSANFTIWSQYTP
jgi:hypothetical protein